MKPHIIALVAVASVAVLIGVFAVAAYKGAYLGVEHAFEAYAE